MSLRTRKRIGFAVLTVAWTVVAGGVLLAIVSLLSHTTDSDEHAGIGFALTMCGMLIVLMGNYIVHRANVGEVEGET